MHLPLEGVVVEDALMKNSPGQLFRGRRRDDSKEKLWRGVFVEFAAVGGGVRTFCKARGLSEPSFYAWRRVLGERDGESATPGPVFVELRSEQGFPSPPASSPAEDSAPLELLCCVGRLLIRAGCDRVLLREVLAALEVERC